MIDAHVHLWTLGENGCAWPPPDLPRIHRDFSFADWRARAGGDARAVLVQSQEDERDTAWLLLIAAREPGAIGVVGWTDLLAADAPARVAALARDRHLIGLRPMVQDRAADWFGDPALDPALAAMARIGLVLDALVRPRHLPALARVAARHPALRIVLDHAGKPDPADLPGWSAGIAALAACPNGWCKLSGLVTELGDDAGTTRAVFEALWAAFGPGRLVWGSDWPVLRLAGDYPGWLAAAHALVPDEHHAAVFGGNAAHLYGRA